MIFIFEKVCSYRACRNGRSKLPNVYKTTPCNISATNLAVLSTKSGKVFKIASLSRILMYFFQVFNDVHMLMCTLGAKNEDATLKLLASLREFVRYIQLPYSFSCLF